MTVRPDRHGARSSARHPCSAQRPLRPYGNNWQRKWNTEPARSRMQEFTAYRAHLRQRSKWRRFSNLTHMRVEGYPNLTHRSGDMLQCNDSLARASSSLCTSNRLQPAPAAPPVREVRHILTTRFTRSTAEGTVGSCRTKLRMRVHAVMARTSCLCDKLRRLAGSHHPECRR